MTRRRYIVVRGATSSCGLHPGSKSWRECPDCARAAWLTAAALEHVVPQPPKGEREWRHGNTRRLTATEIARIRELAGAGMSHRAIARTLTIGQPAVGRAIRGETYLPAPGDTTPPESTRTLTQSPRQRAAHQAWTFGEHPSARAERQAMPPLRSEGRSSR